jgi:protein tyrosine/serine phosphatase
MKALAVVMLCVVSGFAWAERSDRWAEPIASVAIPNLHRVAPTIYRSAQPLDGAQDELADLGIKSVISLRWSADKAKLLPDANRVHAPIESWDVDHDEVMRALKALVDPANQPVLLHCRHGADRTGTVIAAYRMVVEDWPAEDAIKEMRDGGYNYHAVWKNMIRFLRKLDVETARAELGLGAISPLRGTDHVDGEP